MYVQKDRFIQVIKVDDEERKKREQQKREREQVSSSRWTLNPGVGHILFRM